jgi:hypothetical protein
VEVVGDLGKAPGGVLSAILIQDIDLDTPFLHRKLGNGRILRASGRKNISNATTSTRRTARGRLNERRITKPTEQIDEVARSPAGEQSVLILLNVHVVLLGNELDLALNSGHDVSIKTSSQNMVEGHAGDGGLVGQRRRFGGGRNR